MNAALVEASLSRALSLATQTILAGQIFCGRPEAPGEMATQEEGGLAWLMGERPSWRRGNRTVLTRSGQFNRS